ncbi:MAG: ABC transporter substrate-binding protein [Alphaproteobacteria bacterium]
MKKSKNSGSDAKETASAATRIYAQPRDISRRHFNAALLGSAALAASAASFGGLKQAKAAPQRGGNLRVASHTQSTNDTFNSAKYVFSNDYFRGTCFYNALMVLDEKGQAQPDLAEAMPESNATATRWTFKLKKGVTFHDGSPVTTADVAYSIMRHKEESVGSSAKALAQNIASVKGDGPSTVVIELVSADVDFPIMMGLFQFIIVKDGTTDFSKANGTGPFKLKEFQPGVRTVGVRNENYFKSGRPYVDSFELFSILDHTARANALLSGDADMIMELRGAAIDEVQKSSVAKVFTTPCPRYTAFQSAIDLPPGSNQDLRLAMAYMIDRKRYLETVLKGRGLIANDQPIMSTSPLYNSALPQREFDLDKAKYHLGKSGIGNSKVELHITDASPFSVDLGQILARGASQAGLNLDLRRDPPDSYWNTVPGKQPFFANTLNPRPTYNQLLGLTWKTGVPWNFSHYSTPEMDSLIDKSRATTDVAQRKQMYDRMQQLIYETGLLILPAFMSYVDGISNKVQGLTPVPVGNLGGFNFADKVWFEG